MGLGLGEELVDRWFRFREGRGRVRRCPITSINP